MPISRISCVDDMPVEEFLGWIHFLNWEVEQEEKAHKKAAANVKGKGTSSGMAPRKTNYHGK